MVAHGLIKSYRRSENWVTKGLKFVIEAQDFIKVVAYLCIFI